MTEGEYCTVSDLAIIRAMKDMAMDLNCLDDDLLQILRTLEADLGERLKIQPKARIEGAGE